jgi:mannose-6-phosphate isomerase
MTEFMKLKQHMMEKLWGRTDIPAAFNTTAGLRIGEIWYDDGAEHSLPLLAKWIFTSENLSIQVHPDDSQAKARGMASGKEECWYIIDALPGAVLGVGTKIPLNDEQLRAAALSGEIENLMDWKPVKPGDYFCIPAGTVHAIGAGITLVEVQQYADITYRLYDYGRLDKGCPRELHLDDGVAVSIARPYIDSRSGTAQGNMQLVAGPHFNLWLATDSDGLTSIPQAGPRWLLPISGSVSVDSSDAGREKAIKGECLLVPAQAVIEMDQECRLLIAAEI